MPIDKSTIPVLIRAVKQRKVEGWKRDYYAKVANSLQVHTKGQLFTKIDTLFPNEHPDSKAHCLATYEPITKGSIWKAINNLNRIFSNSAFSVNVSEEVTAYLNEYTHEGVNLMTYFLDSWISKAVAEDPNGLFVVYPPEYAEERDMCPLQFVRSELIRSAGKMPDGTEYVAFVSEHDSEVRYFTEHLTSKRELFYDETVDAVNARTFTATTYNERVRVKIVKAVVHLVTADGILIYSEDKKEDNYTLVNFAETLSVLPAFPAGGTIADRADSPLYESFVAPFIPFGNLALLQHRNHRAVDLQFSYPRFSELQTPCSAKGCHGGQVKVLKSVNPTGTADCLVCKGTGYTTVQSPYKSYQRRYDPNDEGQNKHLEVDPVTFYAPDVGIIDYSKEAWKDYLKMAEEAVFIMQKVQTGQVQSEESKGFDAEDMYAWLLNVSKMFYNNLRIFLQCLEDYIVSDPTPVTVEKPYSFAILTEEEAFVALSAILTSDSPVFVKGNNVENFVNKFVSKNSPVVKALTVLKQFDPLLFYTTTEIQTFKAGGTVTQEMWTNHVLGYPVLLKLYEQDRLIFDESTDAIIKQLTTQIATYKIPEAGAGLRNTLLNQFNTPAA